MGKMGEGGKGHWDCKRRLSHYGLTLHREPGDRQGESRETWEIP